MNAIDSDLLAAIVAATRTRVEFAASAMPASALEARLATCPDPKGFTRALSRPGWNVIAECKRRSPSRGILREVYDPVALAQGYVAGGAAAISVLTEPTFFDGCVAHLEAVRAAVAVPLLRKDFIVHRYQLLEARVAGADAVLLIVGALSNDDLRGLHAEAEALGLDVLVEVHDEPELDRAVAAGARVIGVNNRNLRTLTVDVDASFRLARRMPSGIVRVAESGLKTAEDLRRLADAGYGAFLIGERFMTVEDPGAALAALLAGGQASCS